jgi:MYXO-CTERM domain-containing protein
VKKLMLVAAVGAALSVPRAAHAFCGFYVNGAGGEMFNDATQVVMMRMGTRTVLSMQNDYRGPLDDFALVVPVPAVLHEADVKTLDKDIFHKVDVMGAPRLVEYWEQDPCNVGYDGDDLAGATGMAMALDEGKMGKKDAEYHVKVEAQFVVGEYQIVILSATEASGLQHWLVDNHYKIPDGAEPLLAPYVAAGSKFFVAKVDPKKVKMVDGRAALSPLRFHYDSDEFSLPIRLGLANSSGKQDLIVSVLAPNQRYELANYKNVTIPTNINVADGVKDRFGEFYAALFDRTVERNPGAVVTEYAWDASGCDPCPGPTLQYGDFVTLGADVLGGGKGKAEAYDGGFVLTRLHARYGKEGAPNDLVFKEATAIVGGREQPGANGKLEERATESSYNNFQGRYIIRHEWTGAIACKTPQRGVWGGPPADAHIADSGPKAATNTAFVARGRARLPMLVAQDIPEIDVKAMGGGVGVAPPPGTSPRDEEEPRSGKGTGTGSGTGVKKGCGCTSDADAGSGAIFVIGVLLFVRRKRA